MLQNGQTCFKNLAVFTPQDYQSMFGHFTTLCMQGLSRTVSTTNNFILFQLINVTNAVTTIEIYMRWDLVTMVIARYENIVYKSLEKPVKQTTK